MERLNEAIVVFDLFNYAKTTFCRLAKIAPLNSVNYVLISPYRGGEIEVNDNVEVLRLSYWMRRFVKFSLKLQGLNESDYIIPITVHSEWKNKKHQGIIFAKYTWIETTNQYVKPTRSCEAFAVIHSILSKYI
jgi:hypothetical protein